eukprot:g33205.t1
MPRNRPGTFPLGGTVSGPTWGSFALNGRRLPPSSRLAVDMRPGERQRQRLRPSISCPDIHSNTGKDGNPNLSEKTLALLEAAMEEDSVAPAPPASPLPTSTRGLDRGKFASNNTRVEVPEDRPVKAFADAIDAANAVKDQVTLDPFAIFLKVNASAQVDPRKSPKKKPAREAPPESYRVIVGKAPASDAGNKKGNSSQRSQSVDLGKIMIPSPPRGVLDQEDIIGKKVWLKVRVLQDGGGHDWVPCLGEVWGYTPGGVRGENKLEVFSAYLDNVLILDPKFMDDVGNIMESEEVDVHKAQELVKDIPVDAEGIGLDIKGYLIPVFVVKRLGSWEGRCIPSGQKINGIRRNELRANLNKYVRKHSAGYVKGELWPSWPAEAGLGLDVQVKAEKNVAPPAPEAPARRSRSRSRSHSLSRAMREHDEERQGDAAMQDAQAESENEDTTRNHMLEAYIAAVNSGQTQAEAVETLRMIYEVDDEEMKATLRSYIKKNAGKQSELMEAGINTLRYLTGREKPKAPEPEVLETPNKAHMDIQKVKRPDIHQPEKTPNRGGLFPVPFGGQESGELIRSASQPSNRNPLIISDGVVNQLFGTNTMQDDGATRAGAGEPEDDGYISARVVHALEGIRKATEGDKKGNPGTRSSISSEDSLDVYLARGCNTLTVEVCPDVTGKELFDALKRACAHAKAKLQQIEWPCLVTNGIAYGLASLQHGGKDHTTLAPWQLSVAHAVTAKPRDFDQYEAPKDDKIEPKPRYPTHFATWLKQAKNEVKMIGSVLGLEHKKERLAALDLIEKAHEQDADVWPENYCYSLWEELKAAWVEELRESRRRLCRILNTDNPRKEDLKFVALAPDSGFRFPRTFDLAHPEGYYQQVCVPRQARALKGIIYGQLHHKRQAPKVGGEPMAEDAGGEMVAEDVDKVGKGREKGDPKKKKEKEKEEKRAYPAGKRLRPKEAADSVKHAPRTKEGKPICWDGATHMGCSRGKECAHAHQPITTTKGLIRRGGLRSGPLIHPNQVDGRVAQLRSQAKAEHDEKVKDGVNQKQGWLPPEEYGEVQYTQLEEEIRELTRGPDAEWLLDPALGDPQRTGSIWKARVEHPEAKRRLEVLQELESAGTFDRIKAWSSYLQSHVRSRLLNAHIENVAMTIDEILLEATEKGCPELAVEAEKEVFAGSGVWTEAMREAGIAHNIPLELYGDPLQKKDRRPEFDLEDPKDEQQERLPEEKKQDEDDLLRFTTYLAHVMGRTEGTIKQRLFAIKAGHLVAGYEDPMLHRTRIWAALSGYKRWQPATKRKYPVLPSMLLWMHQHLATRESFSRADRLIIWAALMVGFFFLLRASEYLVTLGRSWGSTRTLRGCDIEGRSENKQVNNLHHAEEIVIYLKGSKTDQLNQGTVRNQFKSGHRTLCVVTALAEYQNLKPERFRGGEEQLPLFRLEDGRPLQRGDIQSLIQLVAVADGQSTTCYGSHSLRIGGAAAIYQTTKDLETVKRYGRWNSDAFHGYLWKSHDKQRELAKGMASANGQLLAPRRSKGSVMPGLEKTNAASC